MEAPENPPALSPRVRNKWRTTLLGALVGLLIVLVLLMKWLLEFQVATASQRKEREAAVRAATAHCFELASPAAATACRNALETQIRPPD